MNLTKYFNFNYLKENIKKSKGVLLLLILVVPFFTILTLALMYNNKNNIELLNMKNIIFVNLIGMYIIPIGISFSLFGYVYKKSSVDFINSMPINRKSIFITNSIAGILIITIIQLLTMLGIFVTSMAKTNLEIIPLSIIDSCFMMWIAYIFVFFITNLAMTLSGTNFTQIVLTILFVFLVPFVTQMGMAIFNDSYVEERLNSNSTYDSVIVVNEEKHYILPYDVISKGNYEYSNITLIKMIIIGIIAFLLGIYLFQKRKMENIEESFANEKIHLFVKSLTIFPAILLLNVIDAESTFNILAVGIIIVYYFVYDYIVRKKIKFVKSIFALLFILIISQGIVFGMKTFPGTNIREKLNKENIKEISIDYEYTNTSGSEVYTNNEEAINLIFDSAEKVNNEWEKTQGENLMTTAISLKGKGKDRKKYDFNISIMTDDFYKLFDILEKDEDYVDRVKKEYMSNGYISVGRNNTTHFIDDSEKIQEEINKELEKRKLIEIFYINSENYSLNIDKYYYKDHKLTYKRMPVNINENILKEIADFENERTSQIDLEKLENSGYGISYSIYIDKDNLTSSNDLEEYYFDYYDNAEYHFGIAQNDIKKFIEENKNEKLDSSKQYYIICISNYENTYYLFSNKTEELNQILEKEIKQNNVEEKMFID